jgi:hypothetical protein
MAIAVSKRIRHADAGLPGRTPVHAMPDLEGGIAGCPTTTGSITRRCKGWM